MSNTDIDVADLPNGLVAFVKRDCPTCVLVEPVLKALTTGAELTIYTQDDPTFPNVGEAPIDDTQLLVSYKHEIETVPTLIRVENGSEVTRTVGWSRADWEALSTVSQLGPELPESRPGCGSLSVDPAHINRLRVLFESDRLNARTLDISPIEDEIEAMFDRGWSDGLPVVPPTQARVLQMLDGTHREPTEIVGIAPPDLVECSVEKVAINAVMAGCKPEYFPVVLAAVEASFEESFNMHGLLATTWFAGPVVLVNGPISEAIGMNSSHNALGQGNRANATIGRALQLVIRNVGGGRPGEIDRATMGNPGKYTFCFAEREHDSPWEPLSVSRGIPKEQSAVTLFAGSGVQGVMDQLSREPVSLCKSLAASLRVNAHKKMAMAFDAMVCISPEHARVFKEAGWDRAQVVKQIDELLQIPGSEMIAGADGIAEGLPEAFGEMTLPKFRGGGLQLVHVGGTAGLFSGIIGGWASGAMGSEPVTKSVEPWQ